MPIRSIYYSLGLSFLVCGFVGCADGPLGLARYNPVLRDEWKKDEAYGPTFHDRVAQLDEWRAGATSMSPDDQRDKVGQMTDMIRNEPNSLLVVRAVHAVAAFPGDDATAALRLATEHQQPEVRRAACQAWAKKNSPETIEVLAGVLGGDTDLDVRIDAARALSAYPDTRSVQALGLALDDTDPALQRRAVESLKQVTGKDLGENVTAWREYVASGQATPTATISLAERMRRLVY